MKAALRLLASLAALGLVFAFVDRQPVLAALRDLPASLIVLAVLLTAVQIALAAWRWRYTASKLGLPLPYSLAFTECYAASAINQLLPGGVLGDVARAWRQANRVEARGAAIRSVVFERSMGQLALVLATALAWMLQAPWASSPLVIGIGIFALVVALTVAALVFAVRRSAQRWTWARDTVSDLQRAWWPARVLAMQLAISWLLLASIVLLFLLAARAAGAQAPMIVLAPLLLNALLAMAIPFGFAGWGLREGAAALSWSAAGLDASQGVAASISYGLLTLIGSLPGLLALLRLRSLAR